ncbi:MAG: 4Fe-4S dicluster domain-containing protein [Anaerolineae bacterium]|nr:4Fe-4S dicluster domain-containing protein [Anaerolineae bacterium]
MDKQPFIFESTALQELIDALMDRGYQVIGPTVRGAAITYDEITAASDLPVGWADEQNGGMYRLERSPDDSVFGYVVGAQSWKRLLHPPVARLWQAERTDQGFAVVPNDAEHPPYAFLGVRACELAAIAIQDRVFTGGVFVDPIYSRNRAGVFIVAVNCTRAGGTCFCVSAGTGPNVKSGYDLALTEVLDGDEHYFLVEVGTEQGAAVLEAVTHREATDDEFARARGLVADVARHMGRTVDLSNTKERLYENYENPRWEEIAQRCLMCGNCTMVCPTCFCATVEDTTDLTGEHAERRRLWDSCFTMDFSYIHGGSVRYTPKARYRQWLTHKMATWIDEFGMRGCVGCGRCITWCPVGIDITAEVKAIQESQPVQHVQEEQP